MQRRVRRSGEVIGRFRSGSGAVSTLTEPRFEIERGSPLLAAIPP